MPKKAYLASHFSSNQLKQKYLKTENCVESRRWHLLWKLSLGWTLKNSALAVGINYDYAKEILQKYNQLGGKGVKNAKNKHFNPRGGRKPLLTPKQLQKLAGELESRPADGGIWTGPKVARWIEKENSVEKVWNQRGWDYLKKLEYSCQIPRPKHRKTDEPKQAEFKENLPLKVKELKKNILTAK